MKTIEIVGTSAVGKSTFIYNLSRNRKSKADWLLQKDVLGINSNNMFFERVLCKLFGFLGLKLTVNRSLKYADILKDNKDEIGTLYNLFIKSLAKSRLDIIQKIKKQDFFLFTILCNISRIKNIDKKAVVIIDEGIIQNIGLVDDPKDLNEIAESKLLPDAVIFFNVDFDQYRIRINSRNKLSGTQKINFLFNYDSESELKNYFLKGIKVCNDKKIMCKNLGIPILEIEAVNSKRNNYKVEDFILKILNSNELD